MTSTPTPPGPPSRPSFPKARAGYARPSVDSFVAGLSARLDALTQQNAALAEEIRSLTGALAEVRGQYERLASATVEERAQDVLDAADRAAGEVVARAEQTAERRVAEAQRQIQVLEERARQELAWRRRQLQADRDELDQQRQAMRTQLASLRALAVDATSVSDLAEPTASTAVQPDPVGGSEQHH